MNNVPNGLFSRLLMKYPKLWGINSEWVNWDVDAKQLAATLTEKSGHLITTKDVRNKVRAIKLALNRLNRLDQKKTRPLTLQAFLWYAIKLGLRHAADKITKQIIYDEKLLESKYSGNLQYFDKTDKVDRRWLRHINELTEQTKEIRDRYPKDFATVEEIVDETDELVMATGEPGTNNIIQSPANIDLDIDIDIYEQGLSTSTAAAELPQQQEEHQQQRKQHQ
uniref:Uncharacterized protein n=1 Tax=Glossina pallidipes TaxID=7398 RepID=A0A1A9ZWD4_GLOPL